MLKNDFRAATGLSMGGQGRSIWHVFLVYLIFGALMTAVAGMVSAFLPGLMLPGAIVLTQVGILLAMVVLIDFQSVVISPDDYDILAHQPVSSRTYFLVKLTNVLIFTLIIGTLLGGPSVMLLLVVLGPLVALGGLLAVAGITTATTLAILCLYSALLGVVHPRRLRRALSLVQVIAMAAVMMGPIYIDDLFGPALEQMISQDGTFSIPVWAFLAPPAWFASFLPLFAGDWSLGYAAAATVGVASVGILFVLSAGRLSVSYAERLGAITASSERRRRSRRTERSQTGGFRRRLRLPSDISLGNPVHAAAHALVLALLAHLAVQARQLVGPHLPFSRPPVKGGTVAQTIGGFMVLGLIGVFLPWFFGVVYSGTAITVTFIGVLLLAALVAPAVVRGGIRSRMEAREFAG